MDRVQLSALLRIEVCPVTSVSLNCQTCPRGEGSMDMREVRRGGHAHVTHAVKNESVPGEAIPEPTVRWKRRAR